MTHIWICLLTLLISLSGPVRGENSNFGGWSNAAKSLTRSLDDLESLHGAKPSEIEKLIPENLVSKPLKKGEGIRYLNPERSGEAVMIEKGWPGATDPLHSGPYLRVSREGVVTRIPLEGNPILK